MKYVLVLCRVGVHTQPHTEGSIAERLAARVRLHVGAVEQRHIHHHGIEAQQRYTLVYRARIVLDYAFKAAMATCELSGHRLTKADCPKE